MIATVMQGGRYHKHRLLMYDDLIMNEVSNLEARTLFGSSMEANLVVASVAFLLAILALEFVLNLEMRNTSPDSIQSRFQRKMLRKPNRPKIYYTNYHQKNEDLYQNTQIPDPKPTYSIPFKVQSVKWNPNHKYGNPSYQDKEESALKLTDKEKRLTQLLMALYFRKLSKLIESM